MSSAHSIGKHSTDSPKTPESRASLRISLAEFLDFPEDAALGRLNRATLADAHATNFTAQQGAWLVQLRLLREVAAAVMSRRPEAGGWYLLLEYRIPRRSKRIDCVVLTGSAVLVIEFKVGAQHADRAARWQAEDYMLDLRDFHAGSRDITLRAAVVPTAMTDQPTDFAEAVAVLRPMDLAAWLEAHAGQPKTANQVEKWDVAGYSPSPTIIDATRRLFAGHSVAALSHHYADNLHGTVDAIARGVADARARRERLVCFVTGVPGAGKTLAGLEAVQRIEAESAGEEGASFLSGNGPLVKVLQEAIARDAARRSDPRGTRTTKEEALRRAKKLVQNVHEFVREHGIDHPDEPFADTVIAYDEAQRAWDADAVERFHKRALGSEASLILDVMGRRPGWGAVIAIVGEGQEINRGEAGLAEWGRSLGDSPHSWRVLASPAVLGTDGQPGRLFPNGVPSNLVIQASSHMHLSVSVRSPRAQHVANWVQAVLSLKPTDAVAHAAGMRGFRLAFTRSLQNARAWLHDASHGDRRPGLLASSGAQRHRAYGLEMDSSFHRGFPYADWFLNPPGDVRSSFQLEVALTEFECQGLELDFVGLCWGDDLTPVESSDSWDARDFRGSKWTTVRDVQRIRYLINKYRVLMTRAREGMVIWVPRGDPADPTREPDRLNRMADLLAASGVACID